MNIYFRGKLYSDKIEKNESQKYIYLISKKEPWAYYLKVDMENKKYSCLNKDGRSISGPKKWSIYHEEYLKDEDWVEVSELEGRNFADNNDPPF